jgi:hypothetical protein
MKRLSWVLALFVAATPAWCARKITVAQLEELLRFMQQDRKPDEDVANALKQLELSQELTRETMNSLVRFVPGPRSTEQVYVLEARSAVLAPPDAELPSTPAPDPVERSTILEKAASYVTTTYQQLPGLTAIRTTLRFQDNVEAVASNSGTQGGAKDVVTSAGFSNPASFIHFMNSTETPVNSEHGAEKIPGEKDRIKWGANSMIALQEPNPSLGMVFHEAQEVGSIKWLRWQLVNGKQIAVFSFDVPQKKSKLNVNVCCFPRVTQTGIATFYTAITAQSLGDGGGGPGGGVAGNFQTNTDWHNYKATVAYHGAFFIDPTSGIVVRMITQGEFNPTDVVHQLDTRVDYGAVNAGARVLIAPVKTFVNTVVVPNGDSGSGTYTTRCTLFTSEYKDYRVTGGK